MYSLLIQCSSQFHFLVLITFNICLSSPTLLNTSSFLTLFAHFFRSILLHIHISKASSYFLGIHDSAPYTAILRVKHITSFFHISVAKRPHRESSLPVKCCFWTALRTYIYYKYRPARARGAHTHLEVTWHGSCCPSSILTFSTVTSEEDIRVGVETLNHARERMKQRPQGA